VTDNRVPKTAADASRRTVMSGIVGVGVGVPLLAACGSDDSESSGGGSGSGGSDGGSSGGDGGSGSGASKSGAIAKTSEVPVGGAKIFKAEKVVVSQPSKGEFKAFSSVCTHQGCPITKLDGKEIECTCHGSRFAVADGSVANGPASKPLKELKVTVKGADLTVS
jgi:nitrite reductase/ring-hydroxylating ferredoxin subunit